VKPGKEGKFNEMSNMSEENVCEYCDLIRRADPEFVHIKGYKAVGYARDRMGYDKQVWIEEARDYAKKICDGLEGYSIKAEDERSCVVMIARDGAQLEIKRV